MISAPLCHVNFADFWLADQLNSLVAALLDFQFLTCFYYTNGNWLEAGSKLPLLNHSQFQAVFIMMVFRHRRMHGKELCGSADRELHPGLDSVCAMLAALPRHEGGLSASGQRREVLHHVFYRHFRHAARLS